MKEKIMENVKVSVICLVYNHEKYLRKCLDGFVSQECDFKYEVLIHDDASTDSSASIIREYEEKYPEIIKPIYQTENQHSKGIKISKTHLLPKARGEYLAWCEGDDFWTSPHKLQKQVDFLDANQDYSACVHRATLCECTTGQKSIFPNISASRDYTTNEIIKAGGGIFATNSFMIRKDLYCEKPECFSAKGFGDYQLFIYASIVGKVYCFFDVMSQYNYLTSGSWSARNQNKEKRIKHSKAIIEMLNVVNAYYDYKYDEAIKQKILRSEFNIDLFLGNKKELRSKKYKAIRKEYRKNRFKERLKKAFPFLKRLKYKLLKK